MQVLRKVNLMHVSFILVLQSHFKVLLVYSHSVSIILLCNSYLLLLWQEIFFLEAPCLEVSFPLFLLLLLFSGPIPSPLVVRCSL